MSAWWRLWSQFFVLQLPKKISALPSDNISLIEDFDAEVAEAKNAFKNT